MIGPYFTLCQTGLSLGDVPSNQLVGIVLTIVGVVVLDFCADALDGPIRAYLLDVADTEEQDMALNIHAFSAGVYSGTGSDKLIWTGRDTLFFSIKLESLLTL